MASQPAPTAAYCAAQTRWRPPSPVFPGLAEYFKHLRAREKIHAGLDAQLRPSTGAAIAYDTVFCIAPLLLMVIAVAGSVWGREAVHGEIVAQLSGLATRPAAAAAPSLPACCCCTCC